jgi:positive regulator of sigma E activity
MNRVKAMGMVEEDRMIFKAFFMFMMTPLVTLILVGATLAMTS